MRHRKVKQYQLDFKDYLLAKDFTTKTIREMLNAIRTFYREFDVELGKIHLKQSGYQKTIEDIPDKNDIKLALQLALPKYKAIISLMLSSGMGRSEILSLNYQNFIDSISEYLESPLNDPCNVEEITH